MQDVLEVHESYEECCTWLDIFKPSVSKSWKRREDVGDVACVGVKVLVRRVSVLLSLFLSS